MSTVSGEVVSSEESSFYPDESELELGLGLSLGGGEDKIKPPYMTAAVVGSRDRYARILTAKEFPLLGSSTKYSSSSSSSASATNIKSNAGCCGTKRTAEPSSLPGRRAVSQAVGWPPIPTHRMNSSVNHLKSPAAEELTSTVGKCRSKNNVDKTNENRNVATENGPVKASLFVKVNIDGFPIGRKVDLKAYSCYETLAHTLDDMFRPGVDGVIRSNAEEQVGMAGRRQQMRLLGGLSDFVLAYEDKDGDWMLVGDVPWEMFLSAVRRLRIMKTDEAKGLAPRSRDGNRRQLKIYSKILQ